MEYTNMFQMIGRRNATITIKTATDELRKVMHKEEKMDAQLSDKAKKIKEYLASWGPPGAKHAVILSILLGEDITIEDTNKVMPIIFCSCVVPIVNPNSHNYTIGEPVVVILGSPGKESRCLRSDGTVGNVYNMGEKHSRVASDEEVDNFISQVFDEWERRRETEKSSKKEVVGEKMEVWM